MRTRPFRAFELEARALWLNRLLVLGLAVAFWAVAVRSYGRRSLDGARLFGRLHPVAVLRTARGLAAYAVVPAPISLQRRAWHRHRAGGGRAHRRDARRTYLGRVGRGGPRQHLLLHPRSGASWTHAGGPRVGVRVGLIRFGDRSASGRHRASTARAMPSPPAAAPPGSPGTGRRRSPSPPHRSARRPRAAGHRERASALRR